VIQTKEKGGNDMHSILLSVLFLSTISYADPFNTTTTKLTITRQSIHDSKAVPVAKATKPLVVRYNPINSSDCYVLSSGGDIPCGLRESLIGVITPYGEVYPLEIMISESDFMNLVGDLVWSNSSFKTEFTTLAPSARVFPAVFDFSDYDYKKDEPKGVINIEPMEIGTPDGKVIYTVQ
jgi:hypothetical protein